MSSLAFMCETLFSGALFLINKIDKMGCPALGIWVGFLKQPALPGEALQKKILQKKF
jgi:hypothetical protein